MHRNTTMVHYKSWKLKHTCEQEEKGMHHNTQPWYTTKVGSLSIRVNFRRLAVRVNKKTFCLKNLQSLSHLKTKY